ECRSENSGGRYGRGGRGYQAHHSSNMRKENIQGGAGAKSTNEPRTLNMEEKRKLEKLLIADIDCAIARYDERAEHLRKTQIEQLADSPRAEVKKLFERCALARKQEKEAEGKLHELGYTVSYDGSLSVSTYGTLAPALIASDELAKEGRQSLQNLKRAYVIKL